MPRLDQKLKQVVPLVALRAVQLQHAQTQAKVQAQRLDLAQREALSAQLRTERAAAALERQLSGRDGGFGAVELRALQSAVLKLATQMQDRYAEQRVCEQAMQSCQAQVAMADRVLKTLKADVADLQKRVASASDERSLAVAEDLWTAQTGAQ